MLGPDILYDFIHHHHFQYVINMLIACDEVQFNLVLSSSAAEFFTSDEKKNDVVESSVSVCNLLA